MRRCRKKASKFVRFAQFLGGVGGGYYGGTPLKIGKLNLLFQKVKRKMKNI